MPDLIGTTLGPYRILDKIGHGGMATVYKAYQPGMDRLVALKVLPAHYARQPKFVQRFEQEARVIANLEQRNILPVYDFGQEDGTTYLVMRYLQAGTVKDILAAARGPLPLADAARLVKDIAAALDYAHEQGVVHRDVKPSNILVDRNGNAYLTDFGIAKVLEATLELTGSGALGTPAYMAPEQTLGKPVTAQADVYSLGVMLYEMVTGRQPFEADTPMAVALMHVHEPLPLPRQINPDLPQAVERVILKALAKDSHDRYQSAGDLTQAFAGAVEGAEKTRVEEPTRLIELAGAAAEALGSEEVTYDVREELRRRERTEQRRRLLRWLPYAIGAIVIVALIGAAVEQWQQIQIIETEAVETASALALTDQAASLTANAPTDTPVPTSAPDRSATEVKQTAEVQTQAAIDQATALIRANETQSQRETDIGLTPTVTPTPSPTKTLTPTVTITLQPTDTPPPTATPTPQAASGTGTVTLANTCGHDVVVRISGESTTQFVGVPAPAGATGINTFELPAGVYDLVTLRNCGDRQVEGASAFGVSIPPFESFAACTTDISC